MAENEAQNGPARRLTARAALEISSRCGWAGSDPQMQTYHDTEWGIALHDNRALWETLMLEGFQAGLSWLIVLRKREAFRKAFAGFDPYKVARFGDKQIAALMNNEGIIRSRAKIDATIQGARIYCEMEKRGEHFADYCWSFTDNKIVHGDGATFPTSTALSERVSKDLKSRGFKFCGPTITYAWLQAVGIVNDHATHCAFRHRANHKDSKKERTTGGKLVTKHQGEPTSGPGQSGDASMPTDIS